MSADLGRVLVVRPTTSATSPEPAGASRTPARCCASTTSSPPCSTDLGVEVVVAEAPEGMVDACFAYDPVFVTGEGAIELQMAKPARRAEPAFLAAEVEKAGVPVIARLTGAATADGGDMCWLDPTTLAVGRSYRTNAAAHQQLSEILGREGVTVERADLPHHRGAAHVMHLMSVVSPVADDMAVVFEPLAPVPLLEMLAERGYRTVACDPDEFDLQGCNILAVRPGVVVMADRHPGRGWPWSGSASTSHLCRDGDQQGRRRPHLPDPPAAARLTGGVFGPGPLRPPPCPDHCRRRWGQREEASHAGTGDVREQARVDGRDRRRVGQVLRVVLGHARPGCARSTWSRSRRCAGSRGTTRWWWAAPSTSVAG